MTAKKNKNIITPSLSLDTSKKFYLAVAFRQGTEPSLAFVYTLFLRQDKHGAYPAQTYNETHTFNKIDDANMFYQTLSDVVRCNLQSGFGSMVVEMCEGAIRNFEQMTR